MAQLDRRLIKIMGWLTVVTAKAKGLLVPISGGSDSSLLFWLCCQACPEKTVGAFVGDERKLRGRKWLESQGPVYCLAHIEDPYDEETLRWAQFQSKCLSESRWLLSSRNRSEDVLGSYSLASRVAGYFPLVGLWKSEVMELCAQVGVPQRIIDSSRRFDPNCGRPKKLAEIPLELIDVFLKVKTGALAEHDLQALSARQLEYLDSIYQYTRFKARLPRRCTFTGNRRPIAPYKAIRRSAQI